MKKIAAVVLILIAIGGIVGTYLYNKPVPGISGEKPVAELTADSLFKIYESDEELANKLYLDKVIKVKGKVQSLNSDTSGVSVSLETAAGMFGVICKLDKEHSADYKTGQEIMLKGRCTGYLMDVVLVACVPMEE